MLVVVFHSGWMLQSYHCHHVKTQPSCIITWMHMLLTWGWVHRIYGHNAHLLVSTWSMRLEINIWWAHNVLVTILDGGWSTEHRPQSSRWDKHPASICKQQDQSGERREGPHSELPGVRLWGRTGALHWIQFSHGLGLDSDVLEDIETHTEQDWQLLEKLRSAPLLVHTKK